MTIKGIPKNIVVRLLRDTGYNIQPAVGAAYSDVEALLSKDGGMFEVKTLASGDWSELGDGYYTLRLNASDTDTIGELALRVSVPLDTNEFFDRYEVVPAPYGVPTNAPTCLVMGNLLDIGGDPSNTGTVVFRPRFVPGTAGNSLITAEIIRTAADSFGNFNVKLLRSSQVIVEIEQAGIKNLITVPDAPSANLIDLLPPIPPPL